MAEKEKEQTRSAGNSHEILWHDRKRHLGMPLSFTVYSVDSDRFMTKVGFFKTVYNEILLYRILDIKLTRTLGQKIWGVGTIELFSADTSDNSYAIKNIKHPEKIYRFLSDKIEAERNERRVMGREMFGVAGAIQDSDGDGVIDRTN